MNTDKSRRTVLILAAGGLLSLAMGLAAFRPVRAAGPWYVAPGGDDGNDCLSPGAPCASINGAVAKASSGDTIYVAIGTYTGTGDEVVLLGKDANLSGGWDAGFTTQTGTSILHGEALRRGMTVNSSVTAILERFTVQNGFSYEGGGINTDGTLILDHSSVKSNTANGGGGIYCYSNSILTLNESTVSSNSAVGGGGILNLGGTLTLNNSTVRDNSATSSGGGMQNSSYGSTPGTLTLNSSTVSDNSATSAGGGISNFESLVTLDNSTVSGNTVSGGNDPKGGGIYNTNDGTVTLKNSTVSGNAASYGGGIGNYYGSTVILQNSILAGNTASTGPDCRMSIDSSGYNLIGDTTDCTFSAGVGDLTDVSPNLGQLIGAPGVSWHHPLLPGSPAIDAVPLAQCAAADQRGVARPQGPACDMGAYEYSSSGPAAIVSAIGGTPQHAPPSATFDKPLQAAVLDGIGSPVTNTLVTFAGPPSGASGTFADSGTYTTTALTDESGIATAAVFTANGVLGTYVVTATAGGSVTPADFLLSNALWHVAPGGDDNNDCLSPSTPCATINGALAKPTFIISDTILVATGTYTGTGEEVVLLDRSAILSGGWDAAFTTQNGTSTIDGEGSRRGITVDPFVTAVLERFTVQKGFAEDAAGIFNFGSLTLNNSIVTANRARGWTGGIYNDSGSILVLNHSTVSDNQAIDSCGGIYNSAGHLTLNHSSVSGNVAIKGEAGGIRNWRGTMLLNNSTVSGNTAGGSGGGISFDGSYGELTLNSGTISGNTASVGGGIYAWKGTTTLRNTILAGNRAESSPDCTVELGTIESAGYSLVGDTSGCAFTPGTGDLTDVEANLGLLVGSPGYHPLLSGSPAIDAVPLGQCTLATDQRGVARPQGPACDMGAYEYTAPGPAVTVSAAGGTPQHTPPFFAFDAPLQAVVLDSAGAPVSATLVTFFAPVSGPSGTFADSGTNTTTALTNESGVAIAATFTANDLAGSYEVTATVSSLVTPAIFLLSNNGWYVAPGGEDGNDCQTPATPCATVNGVLGKDGFVAGDRVLVAAGTYTGTGDEVVLLDKDAILSGGCDAGFTTQSGTSILDGEGSRRGMTVNQDVTAVVERFKVHSGQGGILNDSGTLTLSSSTIIGNSSYGIDNGGDGTMTLNDCAVSGNTGVGVGGGGTLTINNCTVSGNTEGGTWAPGGIWACGTTHVNNSTIAHNRTNGNGGGIRSCYNANVTLQNSIVAGNTAREGPDCDGSIGSSGYNLIGDTSGCGFNPTTGDLLDVSARLFPLRDFMGSHLEYYPLLPDSPAVDAGNPAGCTDHLDYPLTTDQRGTTRPVDGDGDNTAICDMGSFEYDPANHPFHAVSMPCLTRNYCPDFFDDFSNPGSGWAIVDDSYVRSEYLNGEYRILAKRAGYFYLFRAPACDRQSYTVEVDTRWADVQSTPGSSYGLIFGVTSGFSQYYLFDINTYYNQFRLLRRDLSGFTVIVPITDAPAINCCTGSNHLKVTRNGDQITLEVNGTVLGTWSDSTIGGLTGAGLVTNRYGGIPSSDARFDNFSMAALPGGRAVVQEPGTVLDEESGLSIPGAWRVPVPDDLKW